MSLTSSIALSAFLSVPNHQQAFDNPEQEALRHLSKAIYIEANLEPIAKRIEKKYIPKWTMTYGGYVYIGYRLFAEKRVSYTWTF